MKGSDIMRTMPQFGATDGYQFAGSGLDSGGGGGGGGGGSSIALGTTPTKVGTYKGSDLYAVVITISEDIISSGRQYIEKEYNVDKIVTLSARYNYVSANNEIIQSVDGTMHEYSGTAVIVDVSYQYYEQKDCFVYAVSQLKSGSKLTDFEIIATFTKGD